MLRRARRWIGEQLAFLIVVLALIGSFAFLMIDRGRWGRGSAVVAGAVLFAAVARLVLPSARVGMLAVRARWIDALLYLVLGGLILGVDIRLHG